MLRRFIGGHLFGGLIVLALSGCVNYAPLELQQTELVSAGLYDNGSIALKSVPFFPQDQYQCGPSALASVLSFAGEKVAPEQLVDEVYIPARQGSLQPFLVAAVRKRGFIPYVRKGEGLVALIKELESGKPVLVLQNIGLPKLPQWHYAVVVGWEPETQQLVLRSGKKAEQKRSLKFFEYTWRASQYWSLSVYDSSETPVAPKRKPWLEAASALEATGNWQAALVAYQAIERNFPRDVLAMMGQGNAAYQLKRYAQAEAAYRKALAHAAKPYAPAHNLAWALIRQGKLAEAKAYALTAKDLGGSDYQSAWDALKTMGQ